jgi:hypothetical protein
VIKSVRAHVIKFMLFIYKNFGDNTKLFDKRISHNVLFTMSKLCQ